MTTHTRIDEGALSLDCWHHQHDHCDVSGCACRCHLVRQDFEGELVSIEELKQIAKVEGR